MALYLPVRVSELIHPDRASARALSPESIQPTDTSPPSPVAAAIIADRALSEQMGVLRRVIPASVVRGAAVITHQTVRGLATAVHMPDPQKDGRQLDEALRDLRTRYDAEENTAGAKPTEEADATADNPLLQIGSEIAVVRELKSDLPIYESRRVPSATLGSRLVVRAALTLQARRAPDTVSRAEAADVLANKSLRGVWPRPRTLLALGLITRLLR